jgi:pimeloyl-ACP methyl ester carboxylesterase
MSTTTERTVEADGVELHIVEAGEGPLVVLAHGFPELSYAWRHQMSALAEGGYHVIAPDQRGYGRSSRPEAVDDYDIVNLTGDLLALADDAGAERAVFAGHDWGAMVVWALSLLAPERVAGVVGMSVPFAPRGEMPPTEMMRQVLGDAFFYMLYFQTPGVADADLGRDPATTIRRMLAGLTIRDDEVDLSAMFANDGRGFVERLPEPESLPDWLSQEELDHYIAEFARTGFTGALNWYRNLDRNWELMAPHGEAKVEVPSLFVAGTLDPVLLMAPPAQMDGWVSDHRGNVMVEGAGHWVPQERPEEVNAALLDFLGALDLKRLS